MNIHFDWDEIHSVREHSERKARTARIELLGCMIATKFGISSKEAESRLSGLGDDDIKTVSLGLVDALSFDALLDLGGKHTP